MAFCFSFIYHYHLDIDLFAVVCMPAKCSPLLLILFFIQSSSHGEYTCSIYFHITYLWIYLLVVNDCTTVCIILNHHCATIVIPTEWCTKYQFRHSIIIMYDVKIKVTIKIFIYVICFYMSVLTFSIWRQEGHPANTEVKL